MSDKPTDCRVDRHIRRRVSVNSRWGAIGFVGRLRFLIHYILVGPTEIDTDQGNQGHKSHRTKSAEDDDGDEPRPKAFANLENRGSGHSWSSEMSSSNKEWQLRA